MFTDLSHRALLFTLCSFIMCACFATCYLVQNRAETFLDFEHPTFQGQRRNCHVIWLKTAQRLFLILNALPLKGVITCHTLCSKKHFCVVYDATFYCFFYLVNVVFPLFMPYFKIKRCP